MGKETSVILMPGMAKIFFLFGSCSAFIAIILGAFGGHLLKQKLTPEMFNIFEVGVRYQMYHALALLAVAWASSFFVVPDMAPAGWFFVVGTILFSGSLYAMSLSGERWLGVITPIGGLCFLAGWLWLIWSVWKSL
jgi:uncharacterized membrane protein YgdD (TMEM256/DUF423 family)